MRVPAQLSRLRYMSINNQPSARNDSSSHSYNETPSVNPEVLEIEHNTSSNERDSSTSQSVNTLTLNGDSLKLDALGPVVVNEDGSICRITNWHQMNSHEQVFTTIYFFIQINLP